MTNVLNLLRATELLRRGVARLFTMRCSVCGKRNRIDRWRLIFGRDVAANCGFCRTTLARRAGKP